MEERRKYQRVLVNIPAHYKFSANSPYLSTVLNLSAEGICFLADHAITVGQDVDLKVNLGTKEAVFVRVQVVWCVLDEKAGKFTVGVKIIETSAPDEEKFIKFYCDRVLFVSTHRKKILVVDDEPDMVKLIKLELEQEGYNVICAYDGQDGYEKYLKEKPDLILLDLMLPKLNGHEVCRKIRRNDSDLKTPIIMITAKTDTVDRIRGRVIGAEKYITKPFQIEMLLAEVKMLLQ